MDPHALHEELHHFAAEERGQTSHLFLREDRQTRLVNVLVTLEDKLVENGFVWGAIVTSGFDWANACSKKFNSFNFSFQGTAATMSCLS